MPKLFLDSIFDDIRTLVNVGEQERKNYISRIEALEKINQSLLENLNACTNAETQKALIEDNKTLTEMLELVIKDVLKRFVPDINYCNSLRIASEHLQRIKGENNG